MTVSIGLLESLIQIRNTKISWRPCSEQRRRFIRATFIPVAEGNALACLSRCSDEEPHLPGPGICSELFWGHHSRDRTKKGHSEKHMRPLVLKGRDPKNNSMSPTGLAHFSYLDKSLGQFPVVRTDEVICGRSNLERALHGSLHRYGLVFPEGHLLLDREENEADILRSLTLSADGPSVFYARHYSSQQGFEEMVEAVNRKLEAISHNRLGEDTIYAEFERFLVGNMAFDEKLTFRRGVTSQAEIQGSVSFARASISGSSYEKQEYSIRLSEDYARMISGKYGRSPVRGPPGRPHELSDGGPGAMGIPTFLKMVGLRPSGSKYETAETYRNLERCSALLADLTFGDTTTVYRAPRRNFRDRRERNWFSKSAFLSPSPLSNSSKDSSSTITSARQK